MVEAELHLSLFEKGATDQFWIGLSRELGEIAQPPRVGESVELEAGGYPLWPTVESVAWNDDLSGVELRLTAVVEDPDKLAEVLEPLGWVRHDRGPVEADEL